MKHIIARCAYIYFFTFLFFDSTKGVCPLIKESLEVIYDFNVSLFTPDTLQIVTGFMPLYLSTRMIDERIQNYFYCSHHHKNIHQMPSICFKANEIGIRVVLISLAALSFYPFDDHIQNVGYVFALTLPLTWIGKKFLKKLKTDANIRPKNEIYDHHKKFFGGWPSGHMMEALYATVLFGKQCGLAFGIPLGIFSGFLFCNFVSCNRHYISQLVAGAGLGLIYAYAADKAVTFSESRAWQFDVIADSECGTCLEFSYEF